MTKDITAGIYHKFPNFWFQNGAGRFECAAERQIKTLLKERYTQAGIEPTREELQKAVLFICSQQSIDSVYPDLPGYPVGIIPGTRILVPGSLQPLEPKEGDCDTIEAILFGLLATQYSEQIKHCYGWLKIACQCFKRHSTMPGQILILAGPPNCGKTLVQTEIITPLLGGRNADPYRYAIGRTQFNSELNRSIHLMISDQKNPSNRQDIREYIRDVASNEFSSLHGKNKDAENLKLLRRMTISCNLDETDLGIIPPLSGIENKILLFKCASPRVPFPGGDDCARKKFAAPIQAELSAFLHRILCYEIPDSLQDSRYGVKGYLNPEVAIMVHKLDREEELLELIREHKRSKPEWVLSDLKSGQIHKELFAQDNLRDALRRIAWNPNFTGKLLTRLAERKDSPVTVRMLDGDNLYSIQP